MVYVSTSPTVVVDAFTDLARSTRMLAARITVASTTTSLAAGSKVLETRTSVLSVEPRTAFAGTSSCTMIAAVVAIGRLTGDGMSASPAGGGAPLLGSRETGGVHPPRGGAGAAVASVAVPLF